MPQGDGTGPDGNGPKSVNKGWPRRYETNQGFGGRRLKRRDGSCRKGITMAGDKNGSCGSTPKRDGSGAGKGNAGAGSGGGNRRGSGGGRNR